jgi:hypothetical protein
MLRVDLTGNGTGFSQMLASAKTQAKAFGNSVTQEVSSSWGNIGKSFAAGIAGMFTVQALKSGVDWFINTGKEIKQTAEQVDMSTDSWQKWSQAVRDANLETSGFMRVVESLHQKRTDALTDPKARGELSRLGFSDSEIAGNMDMSEFTRRALENANGGDLQRKYLSDIIGNRGLKFATALPKLDNAQILFGKTDLGDAARLDSDIIKLKGAGGKLTVGIIDTASSLVKAVTDSGHRVENLQRGARGLWWMLKNAIPGKGWLWGKSTWLSDDVNGTNSGPQQAGAGNPQTPPGPFVGPMQPTIDPMDAKLAQQREEQALHEQERQQRIMDSQRSLMTIGDRRASILGELPGLQNQIAGRKAKMSGEDFLADAQKDELNGITGKAREYAVNALRQKYQNDTDDMQLRFNKERGDLKEKNLNFSADSMAKVGLYGASSVAFNPLVSATATTNKLLASIDSKLSRPPGQTPKQRDPHAP